VIEKNEDFIQCIGVTANYHTALGRAFELASEVASDYSDQEVESRFTPAYNLELDTGSGITVESRIKAEDIWKPVRTFYVLDAEISASWK
jgi:hypothetical protein